MDIWIYIYDVPRALEPPARNWRSALPPTRPISTAILVYVQYVYVYVQYTFTVEYLVIYDSGEGPLESIFSSHVPPQAKGMARALEPPARNRRSALQGRGVRV